MEYLTLTFFDKLLGPVISYMIPENLNNDQKSIIQNLMDITAETGFFGHITGQDFISNYIFEIKSEFARGKEETLLLSYFSNSRYDFESIELIFEKFVDKIKMINDIYLGFYPKKIEIREQYLEYTNKINALLNECFKECNKILENQTFGKILVVGLKGVGKTSLIHKIQSYGKDNGLKYEDLTIGFKILKLISENIIFDIYDINPSSINVCYENTVNPDAIIYILDVSKNLNHFKRAKNQFSEIINHFFGEDCKEKLPNSTPILILGNKMDLVQECEYDLLKMRLGLENYKLNYKVGYISSKTNVGIGKNFKWLIHEFLKKIES